MMPQASFDAVDGEDPRRYPPHQPVDFLNMTLDITIMNPFSRSFDGVCTLTMRAVRAGLSLLRLDAVDLLIQRVTDAQDRELAFDYDAEHLIIHFDQPLSTDSDTAVSIHYRCAWPTEGMTFALPGGGYSRRPLVIHTQGETETSRHWFPCLDHPGDRLTTEMIVTIPEKYFALSNGALVKTGRNERRRRMTTYHWKQSVPHVFYLVTLVIGQFDIVEDHWRDIPVQYYVPQGRADDARRTYARTPKMMEFFSERTGVDYPYEKYAQVNVPLFKYGGMENTTATTMTDLALLDVRAAIDNDLDGLISHELAHQWYGDLITARSWPHIWLNEGFATFFATLWRGEQFGMKEYRYEFWKRFQAVAAADLADTPGVLIHSEYSSSFEPFFHKGALAYSKGSCLLQMLRHQLGDDLFWKAIQTYTRRFREKEVETDDLRHVFEEVSGRNLEQFFTQWTLRPGVPHLKVQYFWHPKQQIAEVSITQTQPITEDAPAFVFPLDLYFRAGDEEFTATVNVSTRSDAYRRRFDVKPDLFAVDPHAGLLMKLECEKPRDMWLTQLAHGPTDIARMVAAKHLARIDRPAVSSGLSRLLMDESQHWTLRAECAAALGTMQSPRALNALVHGIIGKNLAGKRFILDHKTRRAIIDAIGKYNDPKVATILVNQAENASTYPIESAATAGLGNMFCADVVPVLVAMAEKTSFFGQTRAAAINALANLNAPEGIDVAKKYAAYGVHERTREVAIRALGRLAHRDEQREDIREFVIDLLNDPHDWAVWAAIDALAEIGDSESRAAIEKRLAGFAKPRTRQMGRDALKRIDAADSAPSPVSKLQSDVTALRKQLDKLDDTISGIEKAVPTDGN